MSGLVLYYTPGTCAFATHIALEEAGAIYEARRVHFSREQQRSPEYLAINPKGRVPALVTPQGVLTETPALLAYVAQTHPQAGLAPLDDPFAFAQFQAFAAYLCSTVHVAHAHRRRGSRWANEEASFEDMRSKVPSTMRACFALIERNLFVGPWALGEAYSAVDPYLYTLSGWLEGDDVDIAEFPAIADHFRRMGERPAVRRALAAEAD